jgi:hypothetical protein
MSSFVKLKKLKLVESLKKQLFIVITVQITDLTMNRNEMINNLGTPLRLKNLKT